MGAWGSGPFENDSACDWAIELADGDDDGPLGDAFRAAMEVPADGYLDVDDASHAIAAAQTLVALAGFEAPLPEDLAEWVAIQPPDLSAFLVQKHREVALAALARVNAPGSELRELWAESEDFDAWLARLDAIVGRLTPEATD